MVGYSYATSNEMDRHYETEIVSHKKCKTKFANEFKYFIDKCDKDYISFLKLAKEAKSEIIC